MKSFLVYKFTCASYIKETCCLYKTTIEEHIKKDNKSHTFKHLHSTTTCFDSYISFSFKIIDKAHSKFDLKIKEALHIIWKKPNLNAQQNHLSLTLSLQLPSPLFCFCLFVCLFFLHFSFIYYLTLITGIFYCLHYTWLLLNIITTHLVSHLSFSCIIFSISALIIDIFYCLDCISLLLHLVITHLVINFIITI